jgi:hypothetical protein
MQFLHVLTAKTLLKNPMQFTGISAMDWMSKVIGQPREATGN